LVRCPTQAKSDLLSRFLELKKENPHEITDQKIRDIVINFLIAGRDTTALTLSWFLYSLSSRPWVQEKLIEELRSVDGSVADEPRDALNSAQFPSKDRIEAFSKNLNYEKLSKLQYLHACLQETLRLYPPVPQVSVFSNACYLCCISNANLKP
jgi:cytochrome P450